MTLSITNGYTTLAIALKRRSGNYVLLMLRQVNKMTRKIH